jgi:acyl transferase domain-containing protein/acyl carrier protein
MNAGEHTEEARLLEYLKRVTGDLRRTRSRLRELEEREHEPIAIVGMACRYPGGVSSPEDLWELVRCGGDAIAGFPTDRDWDLERMHAADLDSAGTSYVGEGGFLYDAGAFDAGFFGISPREALAMDPQQRQLLEVSWEALEHAGIAVESLRGSHAGVFTGVMYHDYAARLTGSIPADLEAYMGIGSAGSVASGRIAYLLGLEGPAVTLDTACSSSLVALHLASAALRRDECSLALVGGVTVMATPSVFIEFSRQRGLALDGRCKSFADAADGTGWSEGVGMLVLERLSEARRREHDVLAVVRGSAVNQDGASNGLTAPNGPSQQRVIQQALASGGLSPAQVDVVEGHGTGTTLGDPIEAQALLATYGQQRPEGRPLWLGSLKSNLGHTQAAAGVGAVIKMVMAMRHGVLPRTLHVDRPSTRVDWSEGSVSLLTEEQPWEVGEEPRRAGVSSFGVSGTNAHVILEEAFVSGVAAGRSLVEEVVGEDASGSEREGRAEGEGGSEGGDGLRASASAVPWIVSGRSEAALRAQAERLRGFVVGEPGARVEDVGLSLAGRSAFERRAVVLGGEQQELLAGLRSLALGEARPGAVEGVARAGGGQVAFLFTGQGSQHVGMGSELYREFALFARALDEVCEHLDEHLGCSLRAVMFGAQGPGRELAAGRSLEDTSFTQAGLFALEVALFRLVESWGLTPDFLLGHSIGELVAAYVSGVFSLQDACTLVAARGRLMAALPAGGVMIAIQASEEEVLEQLARQTEWERRIAIAGVNGPTSVVLSGDEDAVLEMAGMWEARGQKTKRLRVSHAFHSPRMDGMLDEFRAVVEGVSFNEPTIPVVSNLTGMGATAEQLCTVDYWVRHVREAVRFADGVSWLEQQGVTSFLELGPDGVLSGMCQDCFGQRVQGSAGGETTLALAPAMRAGQSEAHALLGALSQLWVRGTDIHWSALFGQSNARRVTLPTYAFQREHYWLHSASGAGDLGAVGLSAADHPLLGAVLTSADGQGWLFTGRLAAQTHSWLGDHAVMGTTLLPGTAFLELALHVAGHVGCEQVRELTIHAPVVLPESGGVQLQISVGEPDESGCRQLKLHTRRDSSDIEVEDEDGWAYNAAGVLAPERSGDLDDLLGHACGNGVWPPPDAIEVDIDELYAGLSESGLDYGPAFQGLRAVWRSGRDVLVEATLPESQRGDASAFCLHPALLDAVLHAIGTLERIDAASAPRLPFSFSGVSLLSTGASVLRARLAPKGADELSLALADGEGRPLAYVHSLALRPLSSEQIEGAHADRHRSLFRLRWVQALTGAQSGGGSWVLLDGGRPLDWNAPPAGWDVYTDLTALSEAIGSGTAAPETVLVPCAADVAAGALAAATHNQVKRVLGLLQQWLADERFSEGRLAFVTRGAVSGGGKDVVDLAGAAVWGLVRTAQAEHPGRFVLVDVEPEKGLQQTFWSKLPDLLLREEPQLAIRGGVGWAPRLERMPRNQAPAQTRSGTRETLTPDESWSRARPAFDSHGTVLITGGTGSLGSLVAKHLVVEHGVRSLVLAGRRGREVVGAVELEHELSGLGARVTVARCDVSDRDELAELIDAVPDDHPLRAVVHASGVLDDGMIDSLSSEQLDLVLKPKVDAALHLHELTQDLDLSAFVLFSSTTSTFGGLGQGNYAAANAFLDALAAYRRERGMAGTSVGWGLWMQAAGMAGNLGEVGAQRIARWGMGALSQAEGLELFDTACRSEDAVVVAMRLDTAALRRQAKLGALPPMMRGLIRVPAARASDEPSDSLAARLTALGEQERKEVVFGLVREKTAAVLGHLSPHALDTTRAFRELGFDSLLAVELRNQMSGATGLRLPATLVFDYPTPAVLAGYLLEQLDASPAQTAAPRRRRQTSLDEPVAIVGMACRYPGGVRSPEDLWQLVSAGRDAITGFPENRGWNIEALYHPSPDHPGTSYVREGGFIHDGDEFDAEFFGVSPREALAMDPQQRLLLEVCWEALERAGLSVDSLRGSQTGVFTGVMYHDYGGRAGAFVPPDLEGYLGIGSAGSIASGRVAYTFGFEGPAMTIDTACSSSLVALHLACGALRGQECGLALAGGVTMLATPHPFVEFSRQRGLAPDGRSKSYADAADGVGWSEGAGILLLECLSDAQRLGHDVLGLVRGSAVNQDGASNGLTAPNGPSQQRVIEQALASAGLASGDVDVVEGHGTGTGLGDPIEAQALLATYGQDREPDRPLWLGSIKSNIGHTQAAAGVAGVIKMVMASRHERLPRTLHVDRPSVKVDWTAGAVSLLTEEVSWQRNGRPRRAAVSSFGLSGTNAHVIIEEPPSASMVESRAAEAPPGVSSGLGVVPWVLSARGELALRDQAERLRVHAQESGGDVRDIGLSLAGRAGLERRAVILGEDSRGLLGGLLALAERRPAAEVFEGVADIEPGPLAFLFTGQGAQRVGMGSELYEAFPVFRDALDEVCGLLDAHLGCSLRPMMFGQEGSTQAASLDETEFTQAGLFALELGLFRLMESWGVNPDYVIGHSIGELVAACVAGVFSLEDACRLVAARGRLMNALPDGGAMVAVQASEQEALEEIANKRGEIALASVNGPTSVVVSGDEPEVLAFADAWRERGRKTRRLRTSHAFHSARMDGMLEQFAEVAGELSFGKPRITVVSNVSGRAVADEELCSAEYWVRHARETVRFADGVHWLCARGVRSFLELGPDGVLSALVQECLVGGDGVPLHDDGLAATPGDREDESDTVRRASEAAPITAASVLRAGRHEPAALLGALAGMWVNGVEVDWRAVFDNSGAERVELPTYAFQRCRYWLGSGQSRAGDLTVIGQAPAEHPLLGAAVALADKQGWLFTGRLSLQAHPWLADHAVLGKTLLPGTAFLELALHVGAQLGCDLVRELTLQAPLGLVEQGAVLLQVMVGRSDESGTRTLSVHSRVEDASGDALASEAEWVCHAVGSLAPSGREGEIERTDSLPQDGIWPPADAEPVALGDLYDRLAEGGLEYGPVFQGLHRAWRRGDEVYAEVSLSDEELEQAGSFGLHPALLDAALHTMALREPEDGEGSPDGVRLPFSWSDVALLAGGASALRVHLSPRRGDAVSIALTSPSGEPVASVASLVTRSASVADIGGATAARAGLLCLDWRAMALDPVAGRALCERPWGCIGAGDLLLDSGFGDEGGRLDLHADLASLSEAIGSGPTESGPAVFPEIVLLECTVHGRDLPGSVHARTLHVLNVIQQWLGDERLEGSRLVVLTRRAVACHASEDVHDLAAAAVWGLVRSAQSEHPGRLVLVDVDGERSSWDALAAALAQGEPQLAIRAGELLAPRLSQAGSDGALTPPTGVSEWRLEVTGENTLQGLSAVACPEVKRLLEPGEIRVEVRAAGVNFRDVLIALGLYPGEDMLLGGEAAGVVMETGAAVEGLAPGDRVMGLFSGALGPLAVTDGRLVVRMPEHWTFAQAASMPVAFLTAYYALFDLADLQSHQRLLVHSAAGGVGMAAVQLARHLGIEVLGTASSGKWGVLEQCGLDTAHIGNSRELSFRDGFLETTDGDGVDVVLNSLVGDFVDASLDLLPRGGCFLEMGKTDVRDPAQVADEHEGVVYRAFDLMDAGPARIEEMLTTLVELFERGALKLPPIRVWDVRHTPDALRFMSQARHVGKIVLTLPASRLASDGTLLITGGTGGLGAVLARHLVVAYGVRNLLLASRAGAAAPGARRLREELEELGASVRIVGCDVSDRDQIEALIASVTEEHPLRGVVHAAGVLDDGVIGSLTPERVERVLDPKVNGAWHLHELTANLDLDVFVLFSSVAATLGGPGQGNYAAANGFLDALAVHRRAQGLPAVAMAWGPWEQTSGMTGQLSHADLARMRSSGILTLSREHGLELLDAALTADRGLVALTRLDMVTLRTRARSDELPSVLRGLIRGPVRQAAVARTSSGSLAVRLARVAGVERSRIVHELLRFHTAAVLGYGSSEALDSHRTFKDLGFDSLAAVELRNRLAVSCDLRLPATLVFDYPTLDALTGHLLEEMSVSASESIHDLDIDGLQLTLLSMSPEQVHRTGMAARLQSILSAWASADDTTDADARDDELGVVSDDEMFELIDREFGVS